MTRAGNLAAHAAPDGANAASFDGTNAYVDLGTGPHKSVLNFGGQITLEAWVQPAASQPNANGDIIAKGDDSGNSYNELQRILCVSWGDLQLHCRRPRREWNSDLRCVDACGPNLRWRVLEYVSKLTVYWLFL